MTPQTHRSFNVEALAVEIHSSAATLATAAARRAAGHLRLTLERQATATAILASATSQVAFLAALTAEPGVEWQRITLFHMDEYLGIRADHPASFRRFLREHVLARIRPATFHFIAGDAVEPLDECDRYAGLLRAQPVNLCCLGVGENGHLAFNDPPVADFADPRTVKLVQLDDTCRRQQVGEGCFPTLDAVPRYAYSLTIPALLAAQHLVGVVPDARKARAVHNALKGPLTPDCPASILRRQPHATLLLDASSASELTR